MIRSWRDLFLEASYFYLIESSCMFFLYSIFDFCLSLLRWFSLIYCCFIALSYENYFLLRASSCFSLMSCKSFIRKVSSIVYFSIFLSMTAWSRYDFILWSNPSFKFYRYCFSRYFRLELRLLSLSLSFLSFYESSWWSSFCEEPWTEGSREGKC